MRQERALYAAENAETEDRLEDAEQILELIVVRLQDVMVGLHNRL